MCVVIKISLILQILRIRHAVAVAYHQAGKQILGYINSNQRK